MLSSLWDETLGGPTGVSSFCSDRWQQREFLRLQWRTLSCTRWLQSQAVVLTMSLAREAVASLLEGDYMQISYNNNSNTWDDMFDHSVIKIETFLLNSFN